MDSLISHRSRTSIRFPAGRQQGVAPDAGRQVWADHREIARHDLNSIMLAVLIGIADRTWARNETKKQNARAYPVGNQRNHANEQDFHRINVMFAMSEHVTEQFAYESLDHPDLCKILAVNLLAPGWLFEELYDSRYAGVRVEVASNPRTPSRLLARMAADPVKKVRRAVLSNPSAPPNVRVLAGLHHEGRLS